MMGTSAGATRVWSPETLGAGGMIFALSTGAAEGSREMEGAGAMTLSS